MKIAVATNDEIHVTGHVGRCRMFIVYDTNNKEIISREVRENSFTHHRAEGHEEHHQHHGENSHNHSHANLIEGLKDCNYLIFQSGGWRVIEDLKNNGIVPFLTDEKIADEAVKKLLIGTLDEKPDNTCKSH